MIMSLINDKEKELYDSINEFIQEFSNYLDEKFGKDFDYNKKPHFDVILESGPFGVALIIAEDVTGFGSIEYFDPIFLSPKDNNKYDISWCGRVKHSVQYFSQRQILYAHNNIDKVILVYFAIKKEFGFVFPDFLM